jgi:hypothetical protein
MASLLVNYSIRILASVSRLNSLETDDVLQITFPWVTLPDHISGAENPDKNVHSVLPWLTGVSAVAA